MVRNLASRALTANDYSVLESRNGEEAAQVYQQRQGALHLLLTDVVLPVGMSARGIAARRALLRAARKVLYVSACTEDAIVRRGVMEPGMAVLEKAFTPTALVDEVRQVLDQR